MISAFTLSVTFINIFVKWCITYIPLTQSHLLTLYYAKQIQ